MSGRSNVRDTEDVVTESVERILPGDKPGFRPAIKLAGGPGRIPTSEDQFYALSQERIGRNNKPIFPEHRIPAIAAEGGNLKTAFRAPSDPFEDDEDKWAARGSLAFPYIYGQTDRLDDDDIFALDPGTIGPRGGGAQAPGELDQSFDKVYTADSILRRPRIPGRSDPGKGMEKNAFRRMLEDFKEGEPVVTQTDVDLLIFSASMTKKCFPKCVRNLAGHGALLDSSEKQCMQQCANAYFEAEALLAKVLSSADPTTTFTYKPKF